MILHACFSKIQTPHVVYSRGCQEIDSRGGFVQREAQLLSTKSEFCRLLFPSGGTVIWKSGFQALAKSINSAEIFVVGLDYKNREVVIDSFLDKNLDFNVLRNHAIQRMRKYGAGPLWFPLRVLIGYGRETYDVNPFVLWTTRIILAVILLCCYTCIN